MITQKELKELLHYDPETGIFTRLISFSDKAKVGNIMRTKTSHGYIAIRIRRKIYKAHRLAWLYMAGVWPKHHIDHLNHIRDDNRLINLREATYQDNAKNRALNKNNKSGVCGVSWYKTKGKWVAQISDKEKKINLGYFIDKFEAACARKSAENKYGYHGNHGK